MTGHVPARTRNYYTSAMARKRARPRCVVIGGPNGAGKTTFARDYLPGYAGLIHFVNVDLIAGGISPLRPGLAAVTAGRVVLRRYKRSWSNFLEVYKPLADDWTLYDNSEASPKWLERCP